MSAGMERSLSRCEVKDREHRPQEAIVLITRPPKPQAQFFGGCMTRKDTLPRHFE